MGARSLVLLVAWAAAATATTAAPGLCDEDFCDCEPTVHPSWLRVNCTLNDGQALDLTEGILPEKTMELDLSGGSFVRFSFHAFNRMVDLRRVSIVGTDFLIVAAQSFYGLQGNSILLEIIHCTTVHIETKAFDQIQGPVTTNISRCAHVVLAEQAFFWLLFGSISDVPRLELAGGVFKLDSYAPKVGVHGPEMTIHLTNVLVSEFPKLTFGSSAAQIRLERVEVRTVREGAFSANTYNIVIAINSSFHVVEGGAFAQKSLIYQLQFKGCRIQKFSSRALQSAVSNLTIEHCRIQNIATGAINTTVATVILADNEFVKFESRGFELHSWNRFYVDRNSFNDMEPHAVVAPFTYPSSTDVSAFTFIENEMVLMKPNSLSFVGELSDTKINFSYKSNYFAQICHCDVGAWLETILGSDTGFISQSTCTINAIFAKCFNVKEGNMIIVTFLSKVCDAKANITCDPTRAKTENVINEIKNTRFPKRIIAKEKNLLSEKNKLILQLFFVIALSGVVFMLMLILMAWIKRKRYWFQIKNAIISSVVSLCGRTFCRNNATDNTSTVSPSSINEYAERICLNETSRLQDMESTYLQILLPTEDKATQTLPEELTKELLETLREKLDDPDNYKEAREMIEHLYELIKVEENCNTYSNNTTETISDEENIYELPQLPVSPPLGRNKKEMVSIGTKAPSLEKLLPFSPYDRQTALCHEYFEPKDLANQLHLYAEIANSDRDSRPMLLAAILDNPSDQPMPRGPYLRAMREKNANGPIKPSADPLTSPGNSTVRSNNSTSSSSSGKMMNRPLPQKPTTFDPGEGNSHKHG